MVKVVYYERTTREKRKFQYKEELGVFIVPAIMIRAGGSVSKIDLQDVSRARRDQAPVPTCDKYFEISNDMDTYITDLIHNEFMDD